VDRPSAGDLPDAFEPPSGARDMIAELCEEMDKLNAANTVLEVRLQAAETVLDEERCERDKDKVLYALVDQRIKVSSPE
jgi:hypothetical protein